MAEIPIEKKSSNAWLWILLALLVLALVLWWILAADDDETAVVADTVAVEQVDGADADRMSMQSPMDAGTMTLAAILANPADYYGKSGFTSDVTVAGPLTDRGFWIEKDGARMFAILIDAPTEAPLDLNTGANISISGGTIRNPSTITDIEGVPLDADTKRVMSEQEAVLVVDESKIDITGAA